MGQVVIPSVEGWYNVALKNEAGCLGIDSVFVTFNEEPGIEPSEYFYIPNAFTPNNDGINDIFKPIQTTHSTQTIHTYNLQVFNRGGLKVFDSEDVNSGWDGKSQNDNCPAGVYVYEIIFEIRGMQGGVAKRVITGMVLLVR